MRISFRNSSVGFIGLNFVEHVGTGKQIAEGTGEFEDLRCGYVLLGKMMFLGNWHVCVLLFMYLGPVNCCVFGWFYSEMFKWMVNL